jgi:pyrroloquinoline-quinone synthase
MTDFDQIVERWNLKRHPFYTAWSAGTLPQSALRRYAAEWGPFIAAVPQGWRTLGVNDHAAEEVEHAGLWAEFAADIGAGGTTGPASRPSTEASRALVATARRLFSDRATAIGALFAFEAQQPETAATKLAGLQTHYSSLGTDGRYFAVHADDYGEASMLRDMAAQLTPADQARASAACAELGEALWDGLSGVHAEACAAS